MPLLQQYTQHSFKTHVVSCVNHIAFSIYNLLATQGFDPRSTDLQIKRMQNLDHSAILACACLSWCISNHSIISHSKTRIHPVNFNGPRPFSYFNDGSSTTYPIPPWGGRGGVILSSMNSDKKSSLFSASKSSINPWHKGSVSLSQVQGRVNVPT